MDVPADAATVVAALRLGWCVAEVRGRNRPDAPPGAVFKPPRPGHALPLPDERTPVESRIAAHAVLIILATRLMVDGDDTAHPSYARSVDSEAMELYRARRLGNGTAGQHWDALTELIYKFDAHIQDTLAARSDTQYSAYLFGRALAECYWALDPGASGTDNPVAWVYLLSEQRCSEIGWLAGRLSRYFHPYTAPAIAGSVMVWKHVAADPKWRAGAAPALYVQIRRWYELVISALDPMTLVRPYQRLRSSALIMLAVRFYWPQVVLAVVGAGALVALVIRLGIAAGSAVVTTVLGIVAAAGVSTAGFSAGRFRRNLNADMAVVAITAAPPEPRAVPRSPAGRRARIARMARERNISSI